MGTGMGRLGRDALVREALAVLAANPAASMGEVATHLGVGRTTLYRHFGNREAMIAEVARHGARVFTDAFRSARPEVGNGLDAVERVCTQLFTVPDVLTLLFADNPIITDDTFAEVERERRAAAAGDGDAAVGQQGGAEGDALEAVIARGQADGSITSEVPVEWAAMYVFLTVGSGHLHSVSAGVADREARARALALTIRAVRLTLAAG